MPEDSIQKLEEKVAFLEHNLDQLDSVVRELGDTIVKQQKAIEHLMQRPEQDSTQDHGPDPVRDKPPHW